MADEISETKTRYERLDPNVVKVFRLAELANKDNEDCHLGELLKFSEDTAMTILMALDCEDNLPPLTEADLLAFVDVQEPDISASTADTRASVVKKFTAAVANLDGSAVQDIYHSAATSPPTKNLHHAGVKLVVSTRAQTARPTIAQHRRGWGRMLSFQGCRNCRTQSSSRLMIYQRPLRSVAAVPQQYGDQTPQQTSAILGYLPKCIGFPERT